MAGGCVAGQDTNKQSGFELGRHSFFDFGPPFDFYEVFVVRQTQTGSSIERITVTPPGDECTQPAKAEVASGTSSKSISGLFAAKDPCSISEKQERRERKRINTGLVFSGAEVALRVQCGEQARVIRTDVLDRDMFDSHAATPQYTSWTTQLLQELDGSFPSGVMDRPVFSVEPDKKELPISESEVVQNLVSGAFDGLFSEAPHQLSKLYRDSKAQRPSPTVRLLDIGPVQPSKLVTPIYPPLARLAHISGKVTFSVDVSESGQPKTFKLESGHPTLVPSVEDSVKKWMFPKETSGSQTKATFEFIMNCPATKQ